MEIRQRTAKRAAVDRYIQTLTKQPVLIDTFNPMLWHALVERVTVYSSDDVRFTFMDGTIITA